MKWTILVYASLLMASRAHAEAIERPPMILTLGEQRSLRAPGLRRFSIGNPIVRGHSSPDQLLLKATALGNADLWTWNADGQAEHRRIRVAKQEGTVLKPALSHALSQLDEAEILITAQGVLLRGSLRSLGESSRIAGIVRGFPQEVLDETEAADPLVQLGARKLESWLRGSGHSARLRLDRIDRDLWIRGSIESPSERVAAERAIRATYPRALVEISALPDSAPTVHFRVYLLELKKDRFRSLGLSWPGAGEGAFRVTPYAIRTNLALDAAIQHMETEGSARLLSSPELVVRAPGEAELFAGGELPIRQQSNKWMSSVQWKSYGLTLQLKVTHTTAQRVRLDILTEVSSLDRAVSSEDKIPGIHANRMKTQVDAQYGVPLLLSGLLQKNVRENARGLPFLRSIPILGLLFGSEDYLKEQSELVAVLFPSASPPPAAVPREERELTAPDHESPGTHAKSDEAPANGILARENPADFDWEMLP